MMDKIDGAILAQLPTVDATKIADLVYFDGPLLSLFQNARGDDYLYYWCDSDAVSNRWLVFRVDRRDLNGFLAKNKSLRQLLVENPDGFVIAVDFDDSVKPQMVRLVPTASLPENYIPAEDAMLEFSPIIDGDGLRAESRTYRIKIDGAWSLRDLADMPYTYSNAYAFLYFLKRPYMDNRDNYGTFRELPWRGGFSGMHFYNDLRNVVPHEDRPSIESMQYSSPGWIEIKLQNAVAFSIRNAVSAQISESVSLNDLNKEIYQELRRRGYSKEAKQKPDKRARKKLNRTPKEPEPTRFDGLTDIEFAKQASSTMEKLLRLDGLEEVEDRVENQLIKLKIVLSFYRRIKALAQYQASGMAQY